MSETRLSCRTGGIVFQRVVIQVFASGQSRGSTDCLLAVSFRKWCLSFVKRRSCELSISSGA